MTKSIDDQLNELINFKTILYSSIIKPENCIVEIDEKVMVLKIFENRKFGTLQLGGQIIKLITDNKLNYFIDYNPKKKQCFYYVYPNRDVHWRIKE